MTPSTPPNPLREELEDDRLPPPCTMVIFGASGDLTARKLVPALYTLWKERWLPPAFAIVGVARRDESDDAFRARMREACTRFARARPVDTADWDAFAAALFYHAADFDDPRGYVSLAARLDRIERARGTGGDRIYYLSTAPAYFATIVERLAAAGLLDRDRHEPARRVIVEKPFGVDLESARALNTRLLACAREDQIYRIDHYLGKETVQNLLVFRLANGIFEPLWNARYVDHVQITSAEAIGIEGRGGYFDAAGIVRDMVQNHLFQVLCLTAMEPPASLDADDLRDEKVKVLRALRVPSEADLRDGVVRGQYTAGSVHGRPLPAYVEERGVAPDSATETYVALRLLIDNWRWAGVPFYLRAGKALPKKVTEVALVFKAPPPVLFSVRHRAAREPNVLAIRIQPDEGISLRFGAKVPGPSTEIHPVTMEFRYGSSFGREPPEAYERLLLDCMLGDGSLFTRGDEVEASWAWIGHLHRHWASGEAPPVAPYAAGSWGPTEADRMMERFGVRWRRP
ncbi:MAG: glucose-6-phosphate dehydrogenase [Myxococcota bacterium]|nr:glucose-6-phosphate dehydrogenase [Myxococcota bacterium]